MADDLLHIVGHVRVVRHDAVEFLILTVGVVGRLCLRCSLQIVARQEGQQLANLHEAGRLILAGKVGHAGLFVVRHGAAEFLLRHLFARDGLDDGRARDEHLARILHHEDEIRDGRTVDRAARAGTHDDRDLRNHARGRRIAEKDAAEARERIDTLLDARAARVVDTDAGCTVLQREVLHLPDLVRMRLAERTARYREVLRVGIDETAVHRAVARHDAIARQVFLIHAEIGAARLHEHIELHERAFIEQHFQPFACRVLATGMLACHAGLAAARLNVLLAGLQRFNLFLNRSHACITPPLFYGFYCAPFPSKLQVRF